MPNATQIQRLAALIRDLQASSGEDRETVIKTFTLTDWHTELAAFCAEVPAAAVRQFCAVHEALTSTRREMLS